MYTSSEINSISSIIEGSSDAYFNLPMRSPTGAPAVRYSTNHVYYAGSDYIAVLDDSTQLLEVIPIENPHAHEGGVKANEITINQNTGRVYAINDGFNTNFVTVLNLKDHALITTIPVGTAPCGGTITPDGSKVYVANKGDNSISIVSTASNMVTGTVSVGASPWGVAINPSGTKAYVTNSGSGTVSVIDIDSETVMDSVTVGSNPRWLTLTPDGKFVYVSNNKSGSVSVIEAGTDVVVQTVNVNSHPEGICTLPDGSEVYVGTDSTVSVINTSDFGVTTIFIPPLTESFMNERKIVSLAVADPSSRFAGRVMHSDVPVANALVRALQAGEEKGRAQTNAAGDYCIFNLKHGRYDLEVSALGYYSQSMENQKADIGRITILNFNLISTGIRTNEQVPGKFALYQNFPNPFNSSTLIQYDISKKSFVKLMILNLTGQKVETLVNEEHNPGKYRIEWQPHRLSSGIYFYQLHVGRAFVETKKLILIK